MELVVKVININKKNHHEILDKCKSLNGYATFDEYVREAKLKGIQDYIGYALDECRKNRILEEFVNTVHREDSNMIFGEYNYETEMRIRCEDAKAAGAQNAKLDAARKLIANKIPLEIIAQSVDLPLDQIQTIAKNINKV